MASSYSTQGRLELMVTGEKSGTWGDITNTNLGLIEAMIDGHVSVAMADANATLSTANASADEARNKVVKVTGAHTAARDLIIPAVEKVYIIYNATTGGYPVTVKVTGQTGVSVPCGMTMPVYTDGTTTFTASSPQDRNKVRVATTASITISTALNSGDTLDGVTLANGDRVLVKNQSSASGNGIYIVADSPARAPEFNSFNELAGSLITVAEGTTNADTIWMCTANAGGTLDSTSVTWASISTLFATSATAASDTVAGVQENAVQSEMETGTSTTLTVTPGRQHYHDSAAKAWACVTYSGGTPTLRDSYNVSSISDSGTGRLTINFTTSFSSAYWVPMATLLDADDAFSIRVRSMSSSSVVIQISQWSPPDDFFSADVEGIFFVGFGDQ